MQETPDIIPLKLREKNQNESNSPLSGGYFVYILIFLSFFVLFMVVSQVFLKKQKQIHLEQALLQNLQLELKTVEIKNRELFQKIQILKTPMGQEQIARKKLKWIRPGEKVVTWEN